MKNIFITVAAFVAVLGASVANSQQTPSSLKTQNSNEIALTVSSYQYKEPSLSVGLKATNVGVEYLGTRGIKDNWFILGGIDYNYGEADYSGSGTKSNNPNYYVNSKAAVGYDFSLDNYVLSLYLGYGYRYLDNDLTGRSSTGALGYKRENKLHYVPLGVTHRYNVSNSAKLVTTLEYDHLIRGTQFSGLSVLNGNGGVAGVPDVTNKQNFGYGVNFSVIYKTATWGIGPYYKYWNIKKSDTVTGTFTINTTKYTGSVREPANNTNEYGIKLNYSF